jgi:hypothetical protein
VFSFCIETTKGQVFNLTDSAAYWNRLYDKTMDSIKMIDSVRVTFINHGNEYDKLKLSYRYDQLINSANSIHIKQDTFKIFIPKTAEFFRLLSDNEIIIISSYLGGKQKNKSRLNLNLNNNENDLKIDLYPPKKLLLVYKLFEDNHEFKFCYNDILKVTIEDFKTSMQDDYIIYALNGAKTNNNSTLSSISNLSENNIFYDYPDIEINSTENDLFNIDTLLNSVHIPVLGDYSTNLVFTNISFSASEKKAFKSRKADRTILVVHDKDRYNDLRFLDDIIEISCKQLTIYKRIKQIKKTINIKQ